MKSGYRVALVGDYNPAVIAHQAIPKALRLSTPDDASVEGVWIHTSSIRDAATDFRGFHGIWCVPASPYANMEGALGAIRYARESRIPFLGTCGGFQHAVIEYARSVCGLPEAGHAETHPEAELLLISYLSCPLLERSEKIVLHDGGLLRKAYGVSPISEGYHCSYGLNPEHEDLIFRNGLRATAHGVDGEVRGIELSPHPFFVATLFQPERRALTGEAPPPVKAFLSALTASGQ